jgi:hypothetical protein
MDAYFWLNICNRFDKFGDVYFTSLGYWRFTMIRAIYFSLCFCLAMFGLLVVSQIDTTIGLSMFALFIVKFILMLPKYQGE